MKFRNFSPFLIYQHRIRFRGMSLPADYGERSLRDGSFSLPITSSHLRKVSESVEMEEIAETLNESLESVALSKEDEKKDDSEQEEPSKWSEFSVKVLIFDFRLSSTFLSTYSKPF